MEKMCRYTREGRAAVTETAFVIARINRRTGAGDEDLLSQRTHDHARRLGVGGRSRVQCGARYGTPSARRLKVASGGDSPPADSAAEAILLLALSH